MNNYMKVIINAMKQWTNDKLSGFDAKFVGIDDALKNKVDSIDGKGLSTNDYTTEEKEKLAGIEAGAQVNVQVDWNQDDPTKPDYVKNRTHYEEGSGATIEWDGNTEDRDSFTFTSTGLDGNPMSVPYYKVSDLTPSKSEIIGGNIDISGYTTTIDENLIAISNEEITVLDYFFIIYGTTFTFGNNVYSVPSPGIYFPMAMSLTYGSTTIKTLDEKFIPETIARVSDIPPIPSIPVTSVNGMTGDVQIEIPEITVNGVAPDDNGNIELEVGSEQVQVDWEQNDDSQVSFIKNKPFYNTEPEYKTIFENQVVDLQAGDGNYASKSLFFGTAEPLLIPDETYKIVIADTNGEIIYDEVCVAKTELIPETNQTELKLDAIYLTNLTEAVDPDNLPEEFFLFVSMLEFDLEQNGEHIYYPNGVGQLAFAKQELSNPQVVLSLYQKVGEEKKLAQRYTHNADWHENNLNGNGYIKNKPIVLQDIEQTLVFDQTVTFLAGTQASEETFPYLPDFNYQTDKYLIVWDGNSYLCTPLYSQVEATVDGWWGVFDIFQCGYLGGEQAQEFVDYPFVLMAIRSLPSAPQQVVNKMKVGLSTIPEVDETHSIQVYRVGKEWQVEPGLVEVLQSNWEETDTTSPSYVQNRPMYKYKDTSGDKILEFNCGQYENSGDIYLSDIVQTDSVELIQNDEYRVYAYKENGRYTYLTGKATMMYKDRYYIGNGALLGYGEDTGDSFVVAVMSMGGLTACAIAATSDEFVKVKIYGPAIKYSKLDERYLPDSVFLKTKWKQVDWAQNDTTAENYVQNRTHWLQNGTLITEQPIIIDFKDSEISLNGENTLHAYGIGLQPISTYSTYTIMWNGEPYEVRGQMAYFEYNTDKGKRRYGETYFLGNLDLLTSWDNFTESLTNEYYELPFILYYTVLKGEDVYGQITGNGAYVRGSVPCTVSLEMYEGIHRYHTLDERFLPKNIQSDWTQNDHKSIDYIKNKPEITLDRISLIDRGNGNKYHIYLNNGELIVQLACERIEVTTMPTKTAYWADEQFDPVGMVVTAIYPDGRKQEVKDYTYSTPMTSGKSVVTITYTELGISYTTSIIITVDTMTLAEKFVDFEYTINDDGSVTLNNWKGTYNGVSSYSCVIPDTDGKVQIIV